MNEQYAPNVGGMWNMLSRCPHLDTSQPRRFVANVLTRRVTRYRNWREKVHNGPRSEPMDEQKCPGCGYFIGRVGHVLHYCGKPEDKQLDVWRQRHKPGDMPFLINDESRCSLCVAKLEAANTKLVARDEVWAERWAHFWCKVEDVETNAWFNNVVWDVKNPLLEFWLKVEQMIKDIETALPLDEHEEAHPDG